MWREDGAWHGERSTPNFTECPNVAVASSLSEILQEIVPEKYFLSAEACRGILRRASRRGEEIAAGTPRGIGESSGIWPAIARSLTARHDGGPCLDRGPNIVAFHLTQDPIASESVTPCISSGNSAGGQACVGVCGAFSAGQSATAGSIAWSEHVAPTIRAGGSGLNQMPSVCLSPQTCDVRGNGDGKTVCTLTGDHQNRVTDYTALALTYQNTGRGWWNESDTAATIRTPCGGDSTKADVIVMAHGQANAETLEGLCPTLNCNREQPIVTTSSVAGLDCRNGRENGNLCGTLQAHSGGGFSYNCTHPVRIGHLVRRLTPTECARLQGFPDWWADLPAITDMTDETFDFWQEVRRTRAEINGKAYKPVRKKQMVCWYNRLHTDSAEYKMWGNGVALPVVRIPLHGMSQLGAKTLGSLFDGSGGFPLAGLLDGITTLWASEIEPYPIAVTCARFGMEGETWF